MKLPPFVEFLNWAEEHIDELFDDWHMDVTTFHWPLDKEEFKVMIVKAETDAIRYSNLQTMKVLRAYHQWLSENL